MGPRECEAGPFAGLPLAGDLGRSQGGGRYLQGRRRQVQEQVPHRLLLVAPADQLMHHPEPPVDVHAPPVDRHLAGDRAEQRRLARAVRPDQRDVLAGPDPEGHIGEELVAPGDPARDPVDIDGAHEWQRTEA